MPPKRLIVSHQLRYCERKPHLGHVYPACKLDGDGRPVHVDHPVQFGTVQADGKEIDAALSPRAFFELFHRRSVPRPA